MSIHQQDLNKGILYALAAPALGVSSAALAKVLTQYMSVHVIIAIQNLICLCAILPWYYRNGFAQLKTQKALLHLVRGLSGWVGFIAFYYAIKNIPLVEGSLLRSGAPLCVPIIIWATLGITVPKLRWLPIIVGFFGIALILRPQGDTIQVWHLVGFLSAVGLAGSMVSTRLLSMTESTNNILFYYFALSVLCSTPFALAGISQIPLWSLPVLLVVGISLYGAMWFYTKSFSYAKASVIAPLGYFSVVYSGLVDWLIWDHTPSLITAMGIGLVISGGILSFLLGRDEKIVDDTTTVS